MKEHFKARIEFCYAKRKWRPDSCKRRIAETLHLTIKSTGKLARLSVGTGSDFYETVKKRNSCLKLAIYCQRPSFEREAL